MDEVQESIASHSQIFISRRTEFGREWVAGGWNKTDQKQKSTIQQYFMDKHFIFCFKTISLENNLSQRKEHII